MPDGGSAERASLFKKQKELLESIFQEIAAGDETLEEGSHEQRDTSIMFLSNIQGYSI